MGRARTRTPRTVSASYHKLEFRPPKIYKDGFDLEKLITTCFDVNLFDFESKSLATEVKARGGKATSAPYKETVTFKRFIDLEYTNSPNHGHTLNRLTIQGKGLDSLNLDIGKILTVMEEQGFVATEAHSKILLPPSMVTFATIEKHFVAKAYTSKARMVRQEVNPQNRHATTWAVGIRPDHRSLNTVHGKRVIIYEADKVHSELPQGTVEMELQLFGDAAQKFIYGRGGEVELTVRTMGVIRDFLSIKTLTGDRNLSRRAAAKWWDNIVGGFDVVVLPRLDTPTPRLCNQVKHLQQTLYQRKQTLGEEPLLRAMASFCAELGLAERLTDLLRETQLVDIISTL
jgi:hypothetical protein